MIASLTAVAAALTIGLPIFALGERIRGRGSAATRTPRSVHHAREDTP